MKPNRLEAFSDGVIAIIITIMVLDLKLPLIATVDSLLGVLPVLLSYLLSFVIVAIYWVNHHHLIQQANMINTPILWWNMNLLFWLSLVPFATAYLGHFRADPLTVATYGALATACTISFKLLRDAITRLHRDDPDLYKRLSRPRIKSRIAFGLYAASVPCAYLSTRMALGLIVVPAIMYIIPNQSGKT
jgi:uncharacterized membrane protein